ncbi:MAG: metal-dependent hydrolase, partial [Alphaproteobacteria bacterium]
HFIIAFDDNSLTRGRYLYTLCCICYSNFMNTRTKSKEDNLRSETSHSWMSHGVFIGFFIGLALPDTDFLLLPVLHHRSIITHSILIPFLLKGLIARPLYTGMMSGVAIHLFADSLSPMIGFALIYLPFIKESIGELSRPWILINATLALGIAILSSSRKNVLVSFITAFGVLYALWNESSRLLAFLILAGGLLILLAGNHDSLRKWKGAKIFIVFPMFFRILRVATKYARIRPSRGVHAHKEDKEVRKARKMANDTDNRTRDVARAEAEVVLPPTVNQTALAKAIKDLPYVSEEQKSELLMQLARGEIDIFKRAQEIGVDVVALRGTLDTMSDSTAEVSAAGNSVTITHTQDSSVGRTEVIMGNTSRAQSGKLTKSQTGERDFTPFYVIGVLVAIVLIAVVLGA